MPVSKKQSTFISVRPDNRGATMLCALVIAALLASPNSAHAVWQLVWSDEFNDTKIDTNKWTYDVTNGSGWGNSEREFYTARTNNAYVAGGLLHIVARLESVGGFPYTSARMKTQGLFSKTYGRIEIRAKLPQGLGFWPALWMLGTNITSVNWPACGELDIMESRGSSLNQVQGTIHYSDASNNHLSQTSVYTLSGSNGTTTNFHLYAFEWTSNSIKWTVDAATVKTWTSWSSFTGPYPAPFDRPFYLIMNVAVGGTYLGNPTDSQINAGTVFPNEMQVDYVRIYDDVPLAVSIQSSGTNFTIQWPTGTLQSATNSIGPWNDLPDATSPYTVAPVESEQFYQVKL